MTIPDELSEVLVSTADTMGGAVRFQGTRVPVRAPLDELTCGRSLEYFLSAYPGVDKRQAEAAIRWE